MYLEIATQLINLDKIQGLELELRDPNHIGKVGVVIFLSGINLQFGDHTADLLREFFRGEASAFEKREVPGLGTVVSLNRYQNGTSTSPPVNGRRLVLRD